MCFFDTLLKINLTEKSILLDDHIFIIKSYLVNHLMNIKNNYSLVYNAEKICISSKFELLPSFLAFVGLLRTATKICFVDSPW